MDITQLQTGLNKKFEQSRIVFWHDPEQSFTAQLVELADPQAGLTREGQPVAVLNMAEHSQLQARKRIELDEPITPFLLYWPSPEPAPAKDWLLDMRRYSVTFYADAASILLNDLGLANMSLRDYIASRHSFFASKERTTAFKRRLDGRSGMEDALSLDLKMMSVLLGCHAQLSDLMKVLGERLLDEVDSDSDGVTATALAPLEQYGLLPSFWQLMARDYGYQIAEETEPSLRELVRKLFVSECYEQLDAAGVAGRPAWLQSQLLATPTGRANAMALLASWRDSTQYSGQFAALSAKVAAQLELHSRLASLATQDIWLWAEVSGFEAVEQALIRELVSGLMSGDLALGRVEFSQLISRRRQGFWVSTAPKYAHLYQALQQAEILLELRRAYPDGFHYPTAQAIYLTYEAELFLFDAAYRLFNEALLHLQEQSVEVLAALADKIEDLYVNWYLYQLGLAWDGLLAKEQQMARWEMGIPAQSRFYETVIKQRLSQAGVKRQFVIISDALRYEVAHELQGEINEGKRFSAQLKSQLGVLPSYTQLGMAALLPHQQLDYAQGNATVLVDGQSSAGLDNRSAILAKVGGLAISAKALKGWTRAQANEAIGDARVIYIYHDVIDAIGDKLATEQQTFMAVRQAIEELNGLVSRVINGFGVTRVVITADHGFLFQRVAPEVAVKSQLTHEPTGTLEAKKRYLIGRNLPTNDDVWHGRIGDTTKGQSDVAFWLPKGVSRFHFVGGARFVHGGAMLQEICVPLLEVQELRGKKQAQNEKTKVNIVPAYQPIKLVNAIDKIRFLQTDAVDERHKPRTLRFVVVDSTGQSVSALEKLTFDATSGSLEQRQQDVRLKLTGTDFDRKAQYQLLLQDDEDGIELARYPVTIDLAIQNDFGF